MWIQGGIDAKKRFYVATPRIDPITGNDNYVSGNPEHPETIFKQEIDQLKAAGYVRQGEYMVPPP